GGRHRVPGDVRATSVGGRAPGHDDGPDGRTTLGGDVLRRGGRRRRGHADVGERLHQLLALVGELDPVGVTAHGGDGDLVERTVHVALIRVDTADVRKGAVA